MSEDAELVFLRKENARMRAALEYIGQFDLQARALDALQVGRVPEFNGITDPLTNATNMSKPSTDDDFWGIKIS